MLIVSCLSEKGGVGKSTISRLLATSYIAAGWRVKIADLSIKTRSSTDWAEDRARFRYNPPIAVQATDEVKSALKDAHYDAIFFDGRRASDPSTRDVAKISDLIVIPTGCSKDDLRPQIRFASELVSSGIDASAILFVINMSMCSVSCTKVRRFLSSAGFQVATRDIPHRVGYEIAQNQGRSIAEAAYPTLVVRADAVTQEIADAAHKRLISRTATKKPPRPTSKPTGQQDARNLYDTNSKKVVNSRLRLKERDCMLLRLEAILRNMTIIEFVLACRDSFFEENGSLARPLLEVE